MKKEKLNHIKSLMESMKLKQAKLVKAKKLEETLKPTNIGVLLEAELAQAEIILAAKDFLNKFQKMAEDLARMQADSLPLSDNIKETFGPDMARQFEDATTQAVQESLSTIRGSKDKITTAIMRLEGKDVPEDTGINNDMADFGVDDVEADAEESDDDLFGSEETTDVADEPLGRTKKESFDYHAYGKKVLESENLSNLVGWLFEDLSSAMPAAELSKFAGQIATKSAADPVALAGWIGKRKFNNGAKAQMKSTLDDVDNSVLDENWNKGSSTSNKSDAADATKFKDKADKLKKEATSAKKEGDESSYNKKMSEHFKAMAKYVKSSYHSGQWGNMSEAKKDYKNYLDKAKEFESKKVSVSESDRKKEKAPECDLKNKIDENIKVHGKGLAANAIALIQSKYPLAENSNSLEEAFEARYGLTPQAYSIKKARVVAESSEFDYTAKRQGKEVEGTIRTKNKVDAEMLLARQGLTKIKFCNSVKEAMTLTPDEKDNAAAAVGKLAAEMQKDKGLGAKGINQSLSKMDPKERNTANKIINNAKSSGKTVSTVNDFIDATNNDTDKKVNESDNNENLITSRIEFVQFLKSIGFNPNFIDKTKNGYSAKTSAYDSKVDLEYVNKGAELFQNEINKTEISNVSVKVVNRIDSRGNPGYSVRISLDLSVVPAELVNENINAIVGKVGPSGQYVSVDGGSEANDHAAVEAKNKTLKGPGTFNTDSFYKKTPKAEPKQETTKENSSAETPWDIADKEPSEAPKTKVAKPVNPNKDALSVEKTPAPKYQGNYDKKDSE